MPPWAASAHRPHLAIEPGRAPDSDGASHSDTVDDPDSGLDSDSVRGLKGDLENLLESDSEKDSESGPESDSETSGASHKSTSDDQRAAPVARARDE